MLDTTLPFPYQSDQQLADWQESQSTDTDYNYDCSDYCQSFLEYADAEGNVSEAVRKQIFKEHGSDLDEFIGLTKVSERLNGHMILHWLGY